MNFEDAPTAAALETTKLISSPASEQAFLSSELRDHFEPIFTTQTFFLDKTLNLQPV